MARDSKLQPSDLRSSLLLIISQPSLLGRRVGRCVGGGGRGFFLILPVILLDDRYLPWEGGGEICARHSKLFSMRAASSLG